MKLFGVCLNAVMTAQKKTHPDLPIPYFIDAILSHLTAHGAVTQALGEVGLFRIACLKPALQAAKKSLESGTPLDVQTLDVHVACDLVKSFVRDLDACLMTPQLFDQWIAAADEQAAEAQRVASYFRLVQQLPAQNKALLQRLVHFLRIVDHNSAANLMTSENLSVVWGPNLLWVNSSSSAAAAAKGDAVAVMQLMIESQRVNAVAKDLIRFYDDVFCPAPGPTEWGILDFRCNVSEQPLVSLAVLAPAESPQSYQVWVTDGLGMISAFDVETGRLVRSFDSKQGIVFSMATIGRGQVWTTSKSSFAVWNSSSGTPKKVVDGFHYSACFVNGLAWTGGDSKIMIWDPETAECVQEISQPGTVSLCMCTVGSGQSCAVWVGGTDAKIRVYDSAKGELVKEIAAPFKKISKLAAVASGRVWSAHDEGICVWDPRSFAKVGEIKSEFMKLVSDIQAVGETVIAASRDNIVRVWDAKTLRLLGSLPIAHTDAIACTLPTWNRARCIWQLWTSSWDGSICVWDLNSQLAKLPAQPVRDLAQSPATARRAARPSITIQPTAVDATRLSLIDLPAPKPARPTRKGSRKREVFLPEATEDADSLPDMWRTMTLRRAIDPATPVAGLIKAALKHTKSTVPESAMVAWFSSKRLNTCADLMAAPDEVWAEVQSFVGRQVINSLSTVLCWVKTPEGTTNRWQGSTRSLTVGASIALTAAAAESAPSCTSPSSGAPAKPLPVPPKKLSEVSQKRPSGGSLAPARSPPAVPAKPEGKASPPVPPPQSMKPSFRAQPSEREEQPQEEQPPEQATEEFPTEEPEPDQGVPPEPGTLPLKPQQ